MKSNKHITLALLLACTAFAACKQDKAPVQTYRTPADLYVDDDSLIYGFCVRGTAGDLLKMVTSNTGDTLLLNIAEARRNKQVLGTLATNDEVCVAVNSDTTVANLVINKSAMIGDWVRPNPLDGSSDTGVSLREGGEAESIDLTDINYRSWRLHNGRLQLVEIRDDGTDIEDIREFTIKRITPDSLILKEEGVEMDANMEEGDLMLEYGRKKNLPKEDLGIELDDGMGENFRI